MGLNALMTVNFTYRIPVITQHLHNIVPQATTSRDSIDPQLYAEMKPEVASLRLVETLYSSQAPGSIRSNIELAQTLQKNMNFIYPVRQYTSWSARRTLTPFRLIAWNGGKRHNLYRHPFVSDAHSNHRSFADSGNGNDRHQRLHA
jgi:hypothetical protein